MKSQKTKAVLYILLIFLCGFLAGAVTTNIWTNWSLFGSRAQADSPSASKRRSTAQAVQWFQQELDLSSEQASQLHQILDETRQAYRQHEMEIETIRQAGNARIRAILREEQKAKFDEMIAQLEQKRRRRMKSGSRDQ
ncbi:MAG: hypothetical protein HY647_01170 [Acidobacteria bacterium]|nr:hypothetical protein [Acidobacteriota bacterium]